MNPEPSKQELLNSLQVIRTMCDQMERKVNNIIPERTWLSTNEFAEKSGLTPQSISTYCSRGDFGEHQKKNSKGRWLIHKSELAQ